jgi:hypothetical protein
LQASIDALVAELKRPKYGQYDIYLSNVLKPSQLERLAEADEHEVRAPTSMLGSHATPPPYGCV